MLLIFFLIVHFCLHVCFCCLFLETGSHMFQAVLKLAQDKNDLELLILLLSLPQFWCHHAWFKWFPEMELWSAL